MSLTRQRCYRYLGVLEEKGPATALGLFIRLYHSPGHSLRTPGTEAAIRARIQIYREQAERGLPLRMPAQQESIKHEQPTIKAS